MTKLRVGRESSWHVDDVEAFLARGLALATSARGRAPRDSIALADVMRVKLRDADAKTDIVAALFDGRLPVVGLQGSDLGGLFVKRSALNEFILNKRRSSRATRFSFQETARIDRPGPDGVADALRQGLICFGLSVTDGAACRQRPWSSSTPNSSSCVPWPMRWECMSGNWRMSDVKRVFLWLNCAGRKAVPSRSWPAGTSQP